MRFIFDDSKIVCQRLQANADEELLVDVVAFDAQPESLPQHVLDLLTPVEIKELEQFRAAQSRRGAKSEHTVILDALPTLIDRVRGVLVSQGQIDECLHQQLTAAKDRLGDTLLKVQIEPSERG